VFHTIVSFSPGERSMLPSSLLVLFFLVSAIVAWLTYGRRTTRFVADFARLLESPRSVDGFRHWTGGRSAVDGEFHGRKVGIVLQNGDEEVPSRVVIAMATHAPPEMDTYDFAGYRADRDGELAAFALEVTHSLRLRHVEGVLRASRDSFPSSFDPSRWQSVLEAMDTLCRSMERRSFPPPSGLHG
jgi:hypothetical protein